MNNRLYNQTVTVYCPMRDTTASNSVTFVRVVVPGCHWEENSILVFRNTGTVQTANFEVIFPRGKDDEIPRQITPEEWARLPVDNIDFLEQHYALSLSATLDAIWTTPRVFRGVLDHRFGWGASSAMTTQMNTVAAQYGIKTIKDVNYNWFGDRKLHHIAVR